MGGDVSGVSRSLPFTSSPYKVAPVLTSTSVSSMSNSTGGKGKGAASTAATFPKVSGGKRDLSSTSGGSGRPYSGSGKKMRGLSPSIDAEDEEGGEHSDKEDDKESDYVPVTDAAINNMMEGGDCGEMAAIVDMHRRAFMKRAFPPDEEFDNPQKVAASMQAARPQAELDYIEYVVKNWRHGVEVRHMLPSLEKDQLADFCRENP